MSVSYNLIFGQYPDDERHIVSHSELDTGVYETYLAYEGGINKPETIGTYFHLFIEKYGENEFNRIMSLSLMQFGQELNSETNPLKKHLMQGIRSSYNKFEDDLRFRYNDGIYIVTYEPMQFDKPKTYITKKQANKLYSRDLNLYKWVGNHEWEKINNKSIPYDTILSNKYDFKYSIITFDTDVFTIKTKNYPTFKYKLTGMIVHVHFEHEKENGFKGRGKYSQLMFFIKTPNGFDIRVKPINKNNIWLFNYNYLPDDEYYLGIIDENTIYLNLKAKEEKLDGGSKRPPKFSKIEYNILTDKIKYIERND